MPDDKNMPRMRPCEWRPLFTSETLSQGQVLSEKAENFADWGSSGCSVLLPGGRKSISARVFALPKQYGSLFDPRSFSCSACGEGKACSHIAALLFCREKKNGPWMVRESEQEMNDRLRNEKIQRVLQERLVQHLEADPEPVAAWTAFSQADTQHNAFVDKQACLQEWVTDAYCIKRAEHNLIRNTMELKTFRLLSEPGRDVGFFAETHSSEVGRTTVCRITLYPHYIESAVCDDPVCAQFFQGRSRHLCEHTLAALDLVWRKLDAMSGTDFWADRGSAFLEAVCKAADDDLQTSDPTLYGRTRAVQLRPQIVRNESFSQLEMLLRLEDGQTVPVKNLSKLVNAAQKHEVYTAGKRISCDFHRWDWTEDSLPLFNLLRNEMQRMEEERINNAGRGSALDARDSLPLQGELLDRFYDLIAGSPCDCRNPENQRTAALRVGEEPWHFTIQAENIMDAYQRCMGVRLYGTLPLCIRGKRWQYVLTDGALIRQSAGEAQIVSLFEKAVYTGRRFSLDIGTNMLPEFWYRVMPRLQAAACIRLDMEACSRPAQLPEEPAFDFFLDVEDNVAECKTVVTYGTRKVRLIPQNSRDTHRDWMQENRVLGTLNRYFDYFDHAHGLFRQEMTDDGLFRLMTDGTQEMERLGTVHVTDAFRRRSVRSVAPIHLGISLHSGLLQLDISSGNYTQQELLQMLAEYRNRKRYHRMRSGEFVLLENQEPLRQLETLFDELHLNAERAFGEHILLRSHSTLLLSSLLEERPQLNPVFDRSSEALIHSFRSMRQAADCAVPKALQHELRPYQQDGFRWLMLLRSAGFGGILADEMGLGKTLQTIAMMLKVREMGCNGAFLVVCPASLVYNWAEEFHLYAPSLRVCTMSGNAESRQQIWNSLRENLPSGTSGPSDVYIVSYDQMKRDIALMEAVAFDTCVLDEAQYIKNAGTAVSQAAKRLASEHRLALTGTPMENRLSEMWNLFDFLMPGFLYSNEEYVQLFEKPIVKENDQEALARLTRIVSPFILRRTKDKVLTELQGKLEEVRFAHFEAEQQTVYDAQIARLRQLLEEGPLKGAKRIRFFAELTRIRQLCCDPSLVYENYSGASAKRALCMELVRGAVEAGHRLLVFSQFTSMLELLKADLGAENIPYFELTGATPKDERLERVHAFNEGAVPVFLISLRAGGTGLNLTGADMVIHYDPWWNQAAENQATDRAHRIGQRKQVTVYRLIVKNSIEEKMMELQNAKQGLAQAVLGGGGKMLSELSQEELMQLLM